MKKLSILIPHYKSWKWLAICVHAFKRFQFPIEHEIIVADNSPGHPSIKAIADTPLGEGVKVVQGDPELPSHGHGYELALAEATGDWIFTAETDSFPVVDSWGNEYIKASAEFQYIGPYGHWAGGKFVHPCGAMVNRSVLNDAQAWINRHQSWDFVPSAAILLGTSDKAYHVVAHMDWLMAKAIPEEFLRQINIWKRAGVWQNMISFDTDSFSNYSLRDRITRWDPTEGKFAYNRIGYEPGQWLSYYVQHHRVPVLHATNHLHWMPGREGRQAAHSDIFGVYRHIWAGTSATVVEGLEDEVKRFKREQMNQLWQQVPADIRSYIEELERQNP